MLLPIPEEVKVYIQLIILQTLLLVLFSALFVGINQKSQKHLAHTYQSLEAKEALTFDQLVNLKRESMKTLAMDYSYWQDLIDWIQEPNMEWVEKQFEESLNTYGVDLFCIYDSKGKRLTPTLDADLVSTTQSGVRFPDQLPTTILNRPIDQWFQATFDQTPKGIRELFYAPIQPQSDHDRSGKHYGYLATASYWDTEFIHELETLTGATIYLNNDEFNQTSNSDHISFQRSYHDYQERPIITLNVYKKLPVASQLIQKQAHHRTLILVAFTIGGICLLAFIYVTISRPLRKLSRAMETGDNQILESITHSQSEFKHLAQLIVENTKHKQLLQTEIENRRTFEQQLLTAKTRAEQANRAKSQFLANISHETRTPLHTISGFTALLSESNLDDDQQKTLEHIRENADHLVKMLSDIIDLSSIEAEEMKPQRRELNVRELFDEIVAAAQSHAAVKKLEIIEEFSTTIPEVIRTDYARLRHALLSVVDNAIKFTDEGSITLRANYVDTTNEPALTFEVIDTGIGMSEDVLESIFEAFYQMDDSDSRRYGGGGLGLAIARGIARLLGGSIEAESTLGEGTTIRLILPQAAIETKSPLVAANKAE
ncbi:MULTISPECIES: ATP-binding protein [unclassified Lentimonas]|uniref:sensor histidine kinase n=1 Tax=unclassified Lentimonas TaxID=2630993 RepID=UPI001389A4A4|nr:MULTISPECIES: ATP-binding protein [unclassified Lentimonas]